MGVPSGCGTHWRWELEPASAPSGPSCLCHTDLTLSAASQELKMDLRGKQRSDRETSYSTINSINIIKPNKTLEHKRAQNKDLAITVMEDKERSERSPEAGGSGSASAPRASSLTASLSQAPRTQWQKERPCGCLRGLRY